MFIHQNMIPKRFWPIPMCPGPWKDIFFASDTALTVQNYIYSCCKEMLSLIERAAVTINTTRLPSDASTSTILNNPLFVAFVTFHVGLVESKCFFIDQKQGLSKTIQPILDLSHWNSKFRANPQCPTNLYMSQALNNTWFIYQPRLNVYEEEKVNKWRKQHRRRKTNRTIRSRKKHVLESHRHFFQDIHDGNRNREKPLSHQEAIRIVEMAVYHFHLQIAS
jgi:hypothetical protein